MVIEHHTCIAGVPVVTVACFCTTVVPVGSFFTATPAVTAVAVFAAGPADAVTGAAVGILTVTIVAGVGFMSVDTAD